MELASGVICRVVVRHTLAASLITTIIRSSDLGGRAAVLKALRSAHLHMYVNVFKDPALRIYVAGGPQG